jgi:hypothetical protein
MPILQRQAASRKTEARLRILVLFGGYLLERC